jgi:hypothetical protein
MPRVVPDLCIRPQVASGCRKEAPAQFPVKQVTQFPCFGYTLYVPMLFCRLCRVIVVLIERSRRHGLPNSPKCILMLGHVMFILTVEVPLSGRPVSCPGAAIRTSIGELTNISPIYIHDEDLVLATGTWP